MESLRLILSLLHCLKAMNSVALTAEQVSNFGLGGPFSLLECFFLPPIGLSSTGLLLAPTVFMTQPTIPANFSDASWNYLLALGTQVQTTQTSLTLHTTELAGLCQTTDTISHSFQMLLEHLPPTPVVTPTPPTPPETNPALCFDVSAAPHTKIAHPTLPDTYDGAQAGEFFPLDPAKTAALSLYNPNQYGQGKQSLDDYIDSFHALAEQAGYLDGFQLCFTFHESLHPTLMEHINNLAEGHPNNSITT
ncbi:hypothetical protein C0995_005000 [Termitomyces sp. Mi166|nr:hypothetical protein C0995_005000 [Termitomyces sp. Mi166\